MNGAPSAPQPRWREWFDTRFRTAAAVYGLIVYTALLMITSEHNDDVAEAVVEAFATLLVFFLAHVFAQILADHGAHPLRRTIKTSFAHSTGMLYASVPPTIAMVVAGASGATADAASDWAVLVSTVVLGFLGWLAYSRSGAPHWARVVGALVTALMGWFVSLLEYAFH